MHSLVSLVHDDFDGLIIKFICPVRNSFWEMSVKDIIDQFVWSVLVCLDLFALTE